MTPTNGVKKRSVDFSPASYTNEAFTIEEEKGCLDGNGQSKF